MSDAAADRPEFVFEPTTADFAETVLARSQRTLVVVDFWAAWCAPCRALGPLLDRLASEFAGEFLLAKVDTEREPELAAQFAVEALPTVYALRDGRVVDGFMGLRGEDELRAWIRGLLPSAVERQLGAAAECEANDPAAAEAAYRAVLAEAPDHAAAQLGLARVLLARGELAEARAWLGRLEARGFLEPEAEQVRAALELRDQGGAAGGTVEAARAAVAAAPDDRAAQFHLAQVLAAAGQYEEALQRALALVREARAEWGEPARKLMVDVFHVLPADSELTSAYRRQLSMALY